MLPLALNQLATEIFHCGMHSLDFLEHIIIIIHGKGLH